MVLIVRRENPWSPFVQGLSQGLERFGQMRQEQKKRENFMDALVKTGNYTPEQARLISIAPEGLSKEFMKMGSNAKNIEDYKSILAGGSRQQATPIEQIQGEETQIPQTAMQLMQEPPKQNLSESLTNLVNLQKRNLLQKMMGGQQMQGQNEDQWIPQPSQRMQSLNMLMGGGIPAQWQEQLQQPMQQQAMQNVPQVPRDLASIPSQGQVETQQVVQPEAQQPQQNTYIDPASRYEEQAQNYRDAAMLASTRGDKLMADQFNENANSLEKKAYESRKTQDKVDLLMAKKVEPIFSSAEAAKNSMRMTNDQRKLLREGGLSKPTVSAFANYLDKKYGEGTGDLFRSAPTQVFKKIAAKRIGDVKGAMGGAVRSAYMISLYLQQFARETNTNKAMEANFNLTDVQDYIAQVRAESANEIYKENGNHWPKDFDVAMYEKMKQKDDVIAQNIEEMLEPLPNASEWAAKNPGKKLYDKRSDMTLIPVNGNWRKV